MVVEVDIKYRGVEITVDGYYTPEEPMVMYYDDGSGYPGSPAEMEIHDIKYFDVSVKDLYESLDVITEIEDLIIEKLNREYYD
jgi:hypothetical protein